MTPQLTGIHYRVLALAAALLSVAFLVTLAPGAKADVIVCGPGSGAGQCSEPQGLAVDFELNRLYVADQGDRRIDAFEVSGGEVKFLFAFGWGVDTGAPELQKCTTVSTCQQGIAGSGPGQFASNFRSIAVDNDPTSPSHHALYAFDGSNFRVQKFDSAGGFERSWGWGVADGTTVALQTCTVVCFQGLKGTGPGQFNASDDMVAVSGAAGTVYVSDMPKFNEEARIERFSPAGGFLGECELDHQGRVGNGLAVDSSGDVYPGYDTNGSGVRKFEYAEPECGGLGPPYPLDAVAAILPGGLTVDEADALFSGQRETRASVGSGYADLAVYDSAGTTLARFGYGELGTVGPFGVAPLESAIGDVFAATPNVGGTVPAVHYLTLPPPGPLTPAPSLEAPSVRSVSAEVRAEVNPEGKSGVSYRFDWVDKAAFEAEGFASPNTRSSGEEALGASDFRLHAAGPQTIGCKPFSQAALEAGECLDPQTLYRYRVVAKDTEGHEDEAQGELETSLPVEFEALFASEVGSDTATLNAIVNPLGSPASGYFEYLEEAAYLKDIGEGGDGFAEAAQVPDVGGGETPLDFGSGEAGVDESTTLFPLPAGAAFRYRMVANDPFGEITSEAKRFKTLKPQEVEPCPQNDAFRTGPSALLPDCRAFEMVSPIDKEDGEIVAHPQVSTGLPAVLEQARPDGGKLAYGSIYSFGGAPSAPYTSQYIARRDAELQKWVSHPISPPREEPLTGPLLMTDTEFKAFSPDLCEAFIRTFSEPPLAEGAVPGYFNLYRKEDEECGGPAYEAITTVPPATPGLATLELEYQGAAETGRMVALQATDKLAAGATAKTRQTYVARKNPISGKWQLRFACVLPGGANHPGPCTAGRAAGIQPQIERRANLQGAFSADGQRLYWTAAGGAGEIYLRENPFGAGGECSGTAAPCTLAVSEDGEALSGTASSDFWAAAKDGSRAIYTSGNLENAQADLYEYRREGEVTEPIAAGVVGLVGASEDAGRIYFVSTEAIGGEGEAGQPNLYLHEAGEGGGQTRFIATMAAADRNGFSSAFAAEPWLRFSRVSADGLSAAFASVGSLTGYDNTDAESGKADTEVFLYDAAAEGGAGKLVCASCNPSGARPQGEELSGVGILNASAALIPPWEHSLHASGVLAADGSRLYFEAIDPLVARDTNARRDVYQWEAKGTGGCDEADAGYVPESEGCVDLISSGKSNRDSRFVEATPSGDDVFFATLSPLLTQDPGQVDVYDARVNGGLPSPESAVLGCEGEACQGPASAPEDPTPASAAFHGAGNVKEPTGARKRCPKGRKKVKRRGEVRCVKRHRAGRRNERKRGNKHERGQRSRERE